MQIISIIFPPVNDSPPPLNPPKKSPSSATRAWTRRRPCILAINFTPCPVHGISETTRAPRRTSRRHLSTRYPRICRRRRILRCRTPCTWNWDWSAERWDARCEAMRWDRWWIAGVTRGSCGCRRGGYNAVRAAEDVGFVRCSIKDCEAVDL